jgi:4-hydroxybenzoate polyprenyltransferase
MIERLTEYIENTEITLKEWVMGFFGIIFVRFLFESLSSPTPTGIIPSDPYTLIHYGLFFLTINLGLICIIGYFTKNYYSSSKFILFILPLIWLAPILDIIMSHGKGYSMSYIYDTPKEIILDFFRFPTLQPISGITYGMTMYYGLLLVIIGFYVWSKRKNWIDVSFVLILSYIFMFILGALPSVIYALTHNWNEVVNPVNITYYLNDTVLQSNIFHNTLHDGALSVTPYRFFQLGFDKLISQILFILSFCFGIILFWNTEKNKLKAVIKNSRPERILLYLTFLVIGMCLAYFNGLGTMSSWVDYLSMICLLLSWLCVWIYAVQVNDIADIEIDKISNINRPLVEHTLSIYDAQTIGYISFGLALLGSWCAGFYPFFMTSVGLAVSYIYSVPPLRLKRIPILSSFLISTVCLAACLAGFFFISTDKHISLFPNLMTLGILILFTLEINFRDMKDILGDKAQGISTLPTMFGENGPRVVGGLFALSFFLVPIFLSFYSLYIIALPAGIYGYILITKKPFREKPVFILHFTFILLIAFLYFGAYWLAYKYHIIG